MAFHHRLKQRRKANGITQSTLAAIMDATVTTISTWERGAGKPRVNDLPQLSSLLNCSIDWLLTGQEFKPSRDNDAAPPPGPEQAKTKPKQKS